MDEKTLRERYPNTNFPELAPPPPLPDPHLIVRYPSMHSKEQIEGATRELAPEVQPPSGIDANSAEFKTFKRAAQAAGLDTAQAARLLDEILRQKGGG